MSNPQNTEKPAPYSEEAEEAVLGAILTNPNAIFAVTGIIKGEDFYILRHQYIWEAIQRIVGRGEEFDYLTVSKELQDIGKLDEVGGPWYLLRLVNNTPTSVHAEVYALIVYRGAYRRRMMTFSDEVRAIMLNEEMSLDTANAEIEKRYLDVTAESIQQETIPITDSISVVYDKLEAIMNGNREYMGLPTGFRDLDALISGAKPGNFIIVAGRPGMGKSALLGGIALNIVRMSDKPVLWWSGEMSEEELSLRLLSMETGMSTQYMLAGSFDEMEWKKAGESMRRLRKLPLWFDTKPGITVEQLRTKALSTQRQHGLGALFVDYIGLMRNPAAKDPIQEVGSISTALKELARELNVPVFAACQLNRNCEMRPDKRPRLSDLRQSGSLEQDTDIVMFLYRDVVYNPETEHPNLTEAIIAKHRAGPIGMFPLHFEAGVTKFSDLEQSKIEFSTYNLGGQDDE